ncbi:membrane-associated protease 1 [Oceanivirga salmonicida]|uniref:membrane-associated protease 1 n=1 Tax=Oceanivirga salmonicida TaxID=1769291 RepID=UPI0008333B21|nr:membrane-associated protease 1 [Oceanivirga salmonicida]
MGIKVNITGKNDEIILEKDSISSIKYISDTPNDSNARATDLNVCLEITGKIMSQTEDITKKLSFWSLVPSESDDAYRKLILEVISAGVVIRKITMPTAFVIDYEENFDIQNGTGKFKMLIKQKKEKIENIVIEGGYNAS